MHFVKRGSVDPRPLAQDDRQDRPEGQCLACIPNSRMRIIDRGLQVAAVLADGGLVEDVEWCMIFFYEASDKLVVTIDRAGCNGIHAGHGSSRRSDTVSVPICSLVWQFWRETCQNFLGRGSVLQAT